MIVKRLLEILALCMIGEGVVALIDPNRYLKLWEVGPEPFQDIVKEMERRPELARAVAALEVAVGVWLALRETRR